MFPHEGSYTGCGTTVNHLTTTNIRVDPMADDTVLPWHVRALPTISMVTDGPAPTGQYTLAVIDAGFLFVHGLFVNMVGDDITSAVVRNPTALS